MNSKAKHGKDHRFSQAADTSIAIAIAKNTEGNLLASIYIYIYIYRKKNKWKLFKYKLLLILLLNRLSLWMNKFIALSL
jgi:hypothetical protein